MKLSLALLAVALTPAHAAELRTSRLRVSVEQRGSVSTIRAWEAADGTWEAALSASAPVQLRSGPRITECTIDKASGSDNVLLVDGVCGELATFRQVWSLTSSDDVVDISTSVHLRPGVPVTSVEDRFNYAPPKHTEVNEHQGPLDFVWSQNIKREQDDLIPAEAFKSPAVMMQQGPVFVALLPRPNARHAEPLALDLDVTSAKQPWIAFGAIASAPHDHSYFRRVPEKNLASIHDTVDYSYSLVLAAQPKKQGYRYVVRLLWQRLGHPALIEGAHLQRNALEPELDTFDSWRQHAWGDAVARVFRSFPCGDRTCATLSSDRNVQGDWEHTQPDAWFNAWFQTLRSAYGWYLYGRSRNDGDVMRRAEQVLNLALSSPQKDGAFAGIYLVKDARWISGDQWTGFPNSYDTFSMSWTAYWMLRWAEDLTPARKQEVLKFTAAYGNLLLKQQTPNGSLPGWVQAEPPRARPEMQAVNAEVAPSALFLAELAKLSGDARYTRAAGKAMAFLDSDVRPRQRWFDFETFRSCARKDLDFFDPWTAQYPQNNLAEIQAPEAALALYRTTGKASYLAMGEEMLDYLLLTQQVWSNPRFTPNLLGGFTTQNTDAEWSDARQGYAAVVLLDFYDATGRQEYLERAVAAARSTFAVAPWENWAHMGYTDEPGSLTGFHWGTGSGMTSVELMQPELGDAFIDLTNGNGVGFDDCSLLDLHVNGRSVSFRLDVAGPRRPIHVHFRGAKPQVQYVIRWNNASVKADGAVLTRKGLDLQPGTL